MNLQHKGKSGEQQAEAYLVNDGFKILCRRFRSRHGEIDLVASRKTILYFFEVKYRSSPRYGDPLEAITPYKLRAMRHAVQIFLFQNRQFPPDQIFYLAAVAVRDYPHPIPIEWRLIDR